MMWDQISAHISQVIGEPFKIEDRQSIGGGCINQGYRIRNSSQSYFIKLNRAVDLAMFEAEAQGLQQLWATKTLRVPQPICWGTEGSSAYIVLEWLDLGGSGNQQAWEMMGHQLAAMHRWQPTHSSEMGGFGWQINNTIGSTPQVNQWTKSWSEFWRDHRIGYQLKLAKRRGGNFPRGNELLEAIPELLSGHEPQPSLVHGDLWGGNAAVIATGEPVIFDPATYWGDREVDLAMTELFGGFQATFYRGYQQAWPLAAGYESRKILYNLYHILNHFNLFGGSYESQANQMIQRILK